VPRADGFGRVHKPARPARADVDGAVGIERPADLGDVRRFSHEAMATVFEIYTVHADDRYPAQAAQAAFDLLDRLEGELSRFLPNSDITRINHLGAGEQTRVNPSTMECLVIARHVFELTGGAFDASIGSGLTSLELDPEGFLVHATKSGVRVDLGGIGKGYAVDEMAALLEEWGLQVALVHGGFSSVLALEAPSGLGGWPLTLSDPAESSRVLARLSVRQTALGASGLRKKDHIVWPSTGEPVRGRRAAWVAVPRPEIASRAHALNDEPRIAAAAVTDALTTAFMLLSPEEIASLCRQSAGVEAWILPEAGEGPSGPADLLHFGASLNS
jgi:thiamine biosynthesis lipoprotein